MGKVSPGVQVCGSQCVPPQAVLRGGMKASQSWNRWFKDWGRLLTRPARIRSELVGEKWVSMLDGRKQIGVLKGSFNYGYGPLVLPFRL